MLPLVNHQVCQKTPNFRQNYNDDNLETCGDEIVGLLQGAGGYPPVDVNARNAYDRTALHWAAGNNNITALRVLIQMGAQIDAKVCFEVYQRVYIFMIRINSE